MSDNFEVLVSQAAHFAQQQEGWDFSYVRDRRHSDRPPWSYQDVVCSRLDGVGDMLDVDTGGGEVLLDLRTQARVWPRRVYATEGYEPNMAVAGRNLQPIGVEVVGYGSCDGLPFADESFDLVTNRHGAYTIAEIKRILRPNGVFVTQQIGFGDRLKLNDLLGGPAPAYRQEPFAQVISDFENGGFEILEHGEYHGRDVFDDVGAVVFVLTMAPWEIPAFSVDAYREPLRALHDKMASDGPLDIGIASYLRVARRLAASLN